MTRRIEFSPAANAELIELEDYIARRKSPAVAETYVTGIVAECLKLLDRPFQGRTLDDFRPGMRKLGFRRRVDIIFTVTDDLIQIGHVLYGGRDYEALIRAELDSEQDTE